MMTRTQALGQLISEARAEKGSKTSYRRLLRICSALSLSEAERNYLLSRLDYTDADGRPYPWLERALKP